MLKKFKTIETNISKMYDNFFFSLKIILNNYTNGIVQQSSIHAFLKIAHIKTEFFTVETELVFHRKSFCFDLNLQQTESLNMLQQFTG